MLCLGSHTGGFAVVFQVRTAYGQRYAEDSCE